MRLTFYGGVGEVTGSNYLLEFNCPSVPSGSMRILIDCGLHQGSRFSEKQNWEPFPYDPKEISAVFITHAHIDHTGRLAKLVKEGFRGTVYSTPPTRDFAELLLLDSQHILAQEAEHFGKSLLYTNEDVSQLMQKWQGVPYHQEIKIGSAAVTQYSSGHILGASTIVVSVEGKTVIFSGDLGNNPSPLISPGECPTKADYCLIEGTYGDRVHEDMSQRRVKLEQVIIDTIKAGGALMIPTFALERTQILLLEIKEMLASHEIPHVPIFIDSPLAIQLTTVYNRYQDYFRPEVRHRFASREETFHFPGLHMTPTTDDSKSINNVPNPKIIIAGAGMMNGGRILHHARRYLPDPKSTLLIFGYQAEGTLGRLLLEGTKEVKLFGELVPVRAKIKAIGGYSAHADQPQLLNWMRPLKGSVKKFFIVHAEPAAASAFTAKIHEEFHLEAAVPKVNESIEL